MKIIGIAQRYFEGGREAEFFQLAQEGHYFINLWAAHMLIEYGKPTPELQAKVLDIIKFHSATYCTPGNTVNRVVAQPEDQWLDDYYKRKNPVSCN
ncbi:hypothetical protein [Hymenobacter sp. UYCo722]|uniref:hypothetical protein n=1 Tax=Hymenobacter sp. UYCo722 TaxID=3156335 RepID=UPI00339B1FFF